MKATITPSVSTNTNDRNSDRGASCGTDSTIYPVGRLVGHDGPIQAVVFTADGKYCLTGGVDRTVRLWNPSRLDPAYDNNNNSTVQKNQDTHPKDSTTLQRALPIQSYSNSFTHPISAICVCDDDTQQKWLISAYDKTAALTDAVSGTTIRRFRGHYGRINRVACSAFGETYITGSYDATVRIWDGRNRNSHVPIQLFNDAKDSITAVCTVQQHSWQHESNLNRNNNHNNHDNNNNNKTDLFGTGKIVTGSVDGCVRTYDLRKGIVECDDCGSPIMDISLTSNGQYIAISCLDGIIRYSNICTGAIEQIFHSAHKAGTYGLDCSITCDGACIVTGSENGDTVLYTIDPSSDPAKRNSTASSKQVAVQTLQAVRRRQEKPSGPTCSITCHPTQADVIVTASYDNDGDAIIWANDPSYIQSY